MSWLSKAVSSVSKAATQLDLSSKGSALSKVAKVAGTGGLSLAPKGTALNRVATGLNNAALDTSRAGVTPFNAAGAAVGARGAAERLKSNVGAVQRQVPVVMGAASGFAKGGPAGAFIGGGLAIAGNYVAPEFASRVPTSYPAGSTPVPATAAGPGLPGATALPSSNLPGTVLAAPKSGDALVSLGLWLRRTFGG